MITFWMPKVSESEGGAAVRSVCVSLKEFLEVVLIEVAKNQRLHSEALRA